MKIGDYVRDKDGALGKITKIVNEDTFYVKFFDNIEWKTTLEEAKIIKSSPNIIDLIEAGDYVNGKEVIAVDKNTKQVVYEYGECDGFIEEKYIYSIVTKEQFERWEYKIWK